MSHHRHSGAIDAFAIVAAIAFAFGPRAARVVVGGALVVWTALFAWIAIRTVMGAG